MVTSVQKNVRIYIFQKAVTVYCFLKLMAVVVVQAVMRNCIIKDKRQFFVRHLRLDEIQIFVDMCLPVFRMYPLSYDKIYHIKDIAIIVVDIARFCLYVILLILHPKTFLKELLIELYRYVLYRLT